MSTIIAIVIGIAISSYLGIYNSKFLSIDTALSITIIVIIGMILNSVAIKIADNWYDKKVKS